MTTPEYTKRAVDNYRSKFDLLQLRLPKGCKDKISDLTGKKPHDYIIELITADIDRLEAQVKKQPTYCEKPKTEPAESEERRRAREAYENFRMYPKDYTQEELDNMPQEEKDRLKRLTEMKIMIQDMEARVNAKKQAENEEGTR